MESEAPTGARCPHCGNEDPTLITRWIEPRLEDPNTVRKMYCEQCGRTWMALNADTRSAPDS